MQKKIDLKKLLLLVGAFLIAVLIIGDIVLRLLGVNLFAPYLLSNLSESRNFVINPSPDGQLIATTYDFYGDATSTNATEVTIRSESDEFDIRKNTTVFTMDGIEHVNLMWTGNRELTIYYEPGTIDTKLPAWKDVSIKYVEK